MEDEQQQTQAKLDTGLICLINLAKLHGLPADPDHLSHTHADPGKHFTEKEIILAGRDLGLKVRGHSSHWQNYKKQPYPRWGSTMMATGS